MNTKINEPNSNTLALRSQILTHTNSGLLIYAYILGRYYQDQTLLILAGEDCHLTKNPFNQHHRSLMIFVEGRIAKHYDLENAILPGDAFDFARLHFNLSDEGTLDALHRLLYHDQYTPVKHAFQRIHFSPKNRTIYNPPYVSFFEKPISNIFPSNTINLVQIHSYIKGGVDTNHTEKLREISDPKDARQFKAQNFNYATFSGVFSKRNDKSLIRHSGLLTIDFDNVPNVEALKGHLLHDKHFDTELLFVSPSGNGLKWIISIDFSQGTHGAYFNAVSNYIQSEYEITIDQSGKDVSRACFLCHDPEAYINPKYLDQ